MLFAVPSGCLAPSMRTFPCWPLPCFCSNGRYLGQTWMLFDVNHFKVNWHQFDVVFSKTVNLSATVDMEQHGTTDVAGAHFLPGGRISWMWPLVMLLMRRLTSWRTSSERLKSASRTRVWNTSWMVRANSPLMATPRGTHRKLAMSITTSALSSCADANTTISRIRIRQHPARPLTRNLANMVAMEPDRRSESGDRRSVWRICSCVDPLAPRAVRDRDEWRLRGETTAFSWLISICVRNQRVKLLKVANQKPIKSLTANKRAITL